MDELPFPKVRHDHPDTAHAAASRAHNRAPSQRSLILTKLRELWKADDGMTDEEMQDHFHLNPNTQRPRRVELVELGYIEDSGRRRKTRSGRDAIIWMAI